MKKTITLMLFIGIGTFIISCGPSLSDAGEDILLSPEFVDNPKYKPAAKCAALISFLQKFTALERDTDSFYKGAEIVRKISQQLGDDEYKSIRTQLRDLQMTEINISAVSKGKRFDVNNFVVLAGHPIKINLSNKDSNPQNFVLKNLDGSTFVQFGAMEQGNTAKVIKFAAPTIPGSYQFTSTTHPDSEFKSSILKVIPAEEGDIEKYRVVYKGDSGPGLGKNIVFISTDHEYRGEETLPALARILAKRYGFTCTVIWGLDDDGYILPGSSDIKGLGVLKDADLMVLFTRFSNFMDDQMEYIDDYLQKGGPVVGLRTSTHAFNNPNNAKWNHYSFRYAGSKSEWKDGFGEIILGETWVGHYGRNHVQASKLLIEDDQKDHPIMRGVKDPWAQCGGYKAYPENTGGTVLARGRVLNGMTPDSEPDTSKEELPVVWTRNYELKSGVSGRVFTTTHGASEDILSDGFRRMLINACFWGLGMEDDISEDNNIDFVGPYQPTEFNFVGYKDKVRPSDLAGWESVIMPGEIVKKK